MILAGLIALSSVSWRSIGRAHPNINFASAREADIFSAFSVRTLAVCCFCFHFIAKVNYMTLLGTLTGEVLFPSINNF